MSISTSMFISTLTFLVGLLVGLFWKYSDIAKHEERIKSLESNVNVMNVVDIASNIKSMKDSVIFTPQFQQQISTICSEHDRMRSQIDINTTELAVLKERVEK